MLLLSDSESTTIWIRRMKGTRETRRGKQRCVKERKIKEREETRRRTVRKKFKNWKKVKIGEE
jgi:hypothetical protein